MSLMVSLFCCFFAKVFKKNQTFIFTTNGTAVQFGSIFQTVWPCKSETTLAWFRKKNIFLFWSGYSHKGWQNNLFFPLWDVILWVKVSLRQNNFAFKVLSEQLETRCNHSQYIILVSLPHNLVSQERWKRHERWLIPAEIVTTAAAGKENTRNMAAWLMSNRVMLYKAK